MRPSKDIPAHTMTEHPGTNTDHPEQTLVELRGELWKALDQ